ncbi:spore germination protein [Fredinandcohnia quinoae]|uniref:Spore germination protein n=1 Tax=Fredinandcohnia quinoae TaxID=2918902 RepID=A0AAW5E231_9BACI|nr:spore germination protein [Fredinandcohnia sp. SECRCQ15]
MEQNKSTKQSVFPNINDNYEFFKEHIGLDSGNFDVGVRKVKVLEKDVHFYSLNGLNDTVFIIQIIKEIVNLNEKEKPSNKMLDIIKNRLVHQQVSTVNTLDEAVDQLLSGLMIVLIDGEDTGLIVDVRTYPGRSPEEPDTEKVVRGARDGYTENIVENCALTRRRIRDERLRYEMMKVGERSKTDVCIAYIKDIADPDLVKIIKQELNDISIDGLPMADKTVEEFLVKQSFNPYPLVRYTERPDIAATHLLEGHVIIMVDTSPSVIITPTTIFHHLQHAEEYRQDPAIGTFLRWVRFIGIVASLFLLPLWLLMVLEPNVIPEAINYIGPEKDSNIPIIIQIFLADIGIEFLRMAAIHTPSPLSTAMGLIAAALIGQIAIDVGLFVPEVILYVAIAAIGTFATPSYELGQANKIARLCLLIIVAIFKTPGFIIGITLYVLFLASIRSLNTPYLWPFLPFNAKALLQIIIRTPIAGAKLRPSIVRPQDPKRQ